MLLENACKCVSNYITSKLLYMSMQKSRMNLKSIENKNNDYMYNLSTMSYFDTQTHEMHNYIRSPVFL